MIPILENGQTAGSVCTFFSMTKQQQAENNHLQLNAVAGQSWDFTGLSGFHGCPIFVNEAGRALVGLDSLEDARSCQIIEYFDPAVHDTVIDDVVPGDLAAYLEGELRFWHFKTDQSILARIDPAVLPDVQAAVATARETGEILDIE